MKRRTDKRREHVLAAISEPKTVREVQLLCGISYTKAYYALQSLRDDKKCHISKWVVTGIGKPMAVFLAGEGYDAVLGGDTRQTKESVMSADIAIRTAVSSWVKNKPEDEDAQEQ